MDKEQARAIVKNTFENPFDKDRFTGFVRNLLNKIEDAPFTYKGNLIKDAFENHISLLERIGKYTDGESRIDILVVKLRKKDSIERARTMQRNFIAWYLNGSRGGELKDAALVAFVAPNNEDWRFSLVKMDYRFEEGKDGKVKVKEEFTPARRWSFLVGKNENSHTAQSKLYPIISDDAHNPTLKELEEAFNVEKVTKEFFEKYRELFLWTKEELDEIISNSNKVITDFESKGVDTVNFAKKLLGQIVFLYFLQKKGWFGVQRDADWGTGSKHFLRELFEGKNGKYNNFFNDILEPLFYEALRIDRTHDDDYYSRFNCKIPFLNGGLFDPINNYDWVHTDILLTNELFSNTNKSKEGDIGNGILDIFDRYNFTVKEDEPLEKEVAIDPELLGKAYEKFNAIRPDNYEEYKKALESGKKGEENKFNKQFGVYYTPREIVHYMCQQSLICYLLTELNQTTTSYEKIGNQQTDLIGNQGKKGQLDLSAKHTSGQKISREDIETLIKYGEQVGENEATVIAKGRETETYYHKITESIRQNAQLMDDKLSDIKVCDPAVGSGAFLVGMMSEIVKARNLLTVYLVSADKEARIPYHFKRECIGKSLYGVDIDPGAVEIAKLRLWLSLVVDEEDIKRIKPLPNLDYKIICGNSLLEFPDGVVKHVEIENEIEELKKRYFRETNVNEKRELKTKIDSNFKKLVEEARQYSNQVRDISFDFEVYFSEVFHGKRGFDVVIGNPPYISIANLSNKSITDLSGQSYETFSKGADIYCLFYEQGINILEKAGVLCYISSNRFCFTNYGKGLRRYLSHKNLLKLINFNEINVFESANVGSIVVLVQNTNPSSNPIHISDVKEENSTEITRLDIKRINHDLYQENPWSFGQGYMQILKLEIEKHGIPFTKYKGVSINRGITTGLNNVFIISEKIKNEILKRDPKSEEIIVPVLKGSNIKRYYILKPNQYLIYAYTGIEIEKYTGVYDYLKKHKKELEEVYEARHGQKKWYELRKCSYYNEFSKPKLVWTRLSNRNAFAVSENGEFTVDSSSFAISDDLKYLCAVLNSKIVLFYFKLGSVIWGRDGIKWFGKYFDNIPIPELSEPEQQPFITLVDSILSITKDEDYLQNPVKQTKMKALEREIDQLVYKLYGLTEEEIRIVEGEAK